MIHEEVDFERDKGADAMQLFRWRRGVVSGTEIFY